MAGLGVFTWARFFYPILSTAALLTLSGASRLFSNLPGRCFVMGVLDMGSAMSYYL